MTCPHCHESARFVDYRPKTVQSMLGTFALDRAYPMFGVTRRNPLAGKGRIFD
jgi:hypothetical protein